MEIEHAGLLQISLEAGSDLPQILDVVEDSQITQLSEFPRGNIPADVISSNTSTRINIVNNH